MNREGLGMRPVGPRLIARHHIDAVRRLGDVDIVGLAGSSRESAARKASDFKVDRVFENYAQLVRRRRSTSCTTPRRATRTCR
jgi:predicted dehydrogenase